MFLKLVIYFISPVYFIRDFFIGSMMSNKLVKISVIAERLGVSQQTIRRWEKEGLIKSFRASNHSHRRYDLEDIKQQVKERTKK